LFAAGCARDSCHTGSGSAARRSASSATGIIGRSPCRAWAILTGDSSGRWLFRALHKAGFANQPSWQRRDDGLKLIGSYITAVCHCAPPDNKPSPKEIENCSVYLDEELNHLKNARIVIVLGKIAFDNYLKGLRRRGMALPKPLPRFAHNTVYQFGDNRVTLIASYHPSRQNTNTGKLTEPMFDAVFARARRLLNAAD
jgi:uracil-DNA glycosylase family 4